MQLTVRGLDDELAECVRLLAKREGISLNKAVLRLIRKGAGLPDGPRDPDTVGTSLDQLIGTWSSDESDEMDQALREFETIDEPNWK